MSQLSFHPERSGDLYVIPPAYHLVLGTLSQGTDHGTPHEYDRHIPRAGVRGGRAETG